MQQNMQQCTRKKAVDPPNFGHSRLPALQLGADKDLLAQRTRHSDVVAQPIFAS